MDGVLKRTPPVGVAERKVELVSDEEGGDIGKVSVAIGSERSSMETTSRPSSSSPRNMTATSQEDQLKTTKAEMGEVREENERLKAILARIVKNYQALQMQFFDINAQQEQAHKTVENSLATQDAEEHELVSLSLGTSASGLNKQKATDSYGKRKQNGQMKEQDLTLGLDCKFDGSKSGQTTEPQFNLSPENSSEEPKEDEEREPWPTNKILKSLRDGDDDLSPQAPVKRTRVSVRARCDAPTMNDGCQWRKYGQKIAKGNPCPRAYYRCTVAPACPVRKQVQRCAEDMSILITTYEGTHNHPLPISATAMASTTSAAASMLMSGSSTSRSAINGSPASSSTTNLNHHDLNFSLSDHNSKPTQFFPSNSSIYSSPCHPTITLDLTAPPSTSQLKLPSSFASNTKYYSQTSLNFSSSESNATPLSWSNGYLSYGAQPYNKSQMGFLSLGRPSQDTFNLSYLPKATNTTPSSTQNSLTDTIAKEITSDPSFQSALAAAITSYVGSQGAQGAGEGFGRSLKRGESLVSTPSNKPAATGSGCASSYLTRTTSSSSKPQQGNLMFPQPSSAFLSTKSTSASPGLDDRDS